jgi:phosphoglycerate dehydrogenase-like enzyme
VVDIVVAHSVAQKFRSQIVGVIPGRVRLLPTRGGDPSDPDRSGAEIAVSGSFGDRYLFAEIIATMPQLQWIHSTGAGVDDFASRELLERGVWITASSGIYAPAMVEYVLAMLVVVMRNLPGWLEGQRRHVWMAPDFHAGAELYGKRLGVIGYGGIGRRLAAACHALGMEVWATGPRPPTADSTAPLTRFVPSSDLPILLAACDIVVIACPLNSATRGMIGEQEIRHMKAGAILVNVARGPIVDEAALRAALREGRLSCAILDVTGVEPLPAEDPLWDTPNLFLTPHISGDTPHGWQRTIDLICDNLRLYLAGQPKQMRNLVDLSRHL